MPTYTYQCAQCDEAVETFMSIREYSDHPPAFVHCGKRMERRLVPVQLAYVSEDSYKDLRAPDGADISSRAKHREYMRSRNLTTVDDFQQTWRKQEQAREAMAAGVDPQRAHDIARAVQKLGG